ncbi:ubiquinone biosynthesis O-methyltransferase, mitochondrial-like [Mizuhopecten yessoensis]|uniref:ubiquinone biosynthesis O-methyltransferase, mitochondrial-like n=1 Tax=Mizuhopecten yessoensis TaxID=6573 RepID=UPI000B458A8D|nr:ubiquinone biosynthesis O-methyltransferase, mitochondrial-like [Mizuhopecten yessoensis]
MANSVRSFQICRGCCSIFRKRLVFNSCQHYVTVPNRVPFISQAPKVSATNVRCCHNGGVKQKPWRPVAQTTIDEEEMEKFQMLSSLWWNELGEFQALHTMNELRVPMIRDALAEETFTSTALPLEGMQILDAGCGGGLLTEPLARLGAQVIGVDMVKDNIKTAQAHLVDDPAIRGRVKYIQATVEDLVGSEEAKFDAVVASEVVEHVGDLQSFLSSCCLLLKPGGSLFITTINKTQLSRGLAVYAAEKLLRLVPEGTHDWEKFVPPDDLQYLLENNGLTTRLIHGLLYNPLTCRWSWVKDTSMNYALHAVKGDNSLDDADFSQTVEKESFDENDLQDGSKDDTKL